MNMGHVLRENLRYIRLLNHLTIIGAGHQSGSILECVCRKFYYRDVLDTHISLCYAESDCLDLEKAWTLTQDCAYKVDLRSKFQRIVELKLR